MAWAIPLGVVVLVLLGAGFLVLSRSGAELAADPSALARVKVQTFGGELVSARALDPRGRAIPLAVAGGRLTPRQKLTPGERVTVDVTVRRPSSVGWLIGHERHERLTVRAPVARVTRRWLTVAGGAGVRVSFDRPVTRALIGAPGSTRVVRAQGRSLFVARGGGTGSVRVAAAARTWERPGAAETVTWFPCSRRPVAVVTPSPSGRLAPGQSLRLTFSAPVRSALGSARPALDPATPGRWTQPDSHTLAFTPSGVGFALGTRPRLRLPRALAVGGPAGTNLRTTAQVEWKVPPGSTLRLQQLLAQAGYLPLTWKPAGAPVRRERGAEVDAAVDPPAGHFSWRYANTPPELRAPWSEGKANPITRGAIMAFQSRHGLAVDAFAGAATWRGLIGDALAGRRRGDGYSYVYVHRDTPQLLTLWHNGRVVLRSPGNTGVPAAPTELGTFPVFEHIPVGTMSGTNPDGSHYNDPGIKWISYFNGGDALHSFNRASFGTPQSLGCVELPLASAAKVWPYTPIGTLVTIEH